MAHMTVADAQAEGLPSQPRRFQMFIAGSWTDGAATETTQRHSPGHGVPVTEVPLGTAADTEAAVAAARTAFEAGAWSRIAGADRAEVLHRAADLVRQRQQEIAFVETLETGKPIEQSRAEVAGAAGIWDYAAGLARTVHGETFNNLGPDLFGLVTREPIGVVGIITPWNFPFFIAAERYPFALAAGCAIVAKPSELTSGSTLIMAEILQQAGLPDGIFNVVTGLGPVVGQALVEHDDVDMVSFTGSTAVGRSTLRASAGNIKRLGLELGGKNPTIVFPDADIDDALDGTLFGMMFNAGQCCVSGSRLIVHRDIVTTFCEGLVERARKVKVGDPLDETTQVGAIVEDRQLRKILGYVDAGKSAGAALLTGGDRHGDGPGLFMEPTVFGAVTPDMSLFQDEIFGPVLTVTPFDDFDQAMTIANDTLYGLAGSIWTKNLDTATRAYRALRAGRVWVNTNISGGPEMPIGGFKQSGLGRETGLLGIDEYTEVKSVQIALGKRTPWLDA